MQQRADGHVVLDAQPRKRPHNLEGAGDAAAAHRVGGQAMDRLAGERDRTRIRRHGASDHAEQCGLAGAIRADDSEDRALRHGEADPIDREEAAEALAQAIDGQERAHLPPLPKPSRRASGGHTPSGSATITTSRHRP